MASELASREDIRTRLHNTVCIYKNRPVYVTVEPITKVDQTHIVCIYDVGNQRKTEMVDYRSDDFSNSSPQLGYMKLGGNAWYMQRVASRQFQLGVSSSNIRSSSGASINRTTLLTKEFEQCITGNHVSVAHALRSITDYQATTVPIHRHFAVGKSGERGLMLYYRGEPIAISASMTHRYWNYIGAPSVVSCYQKIMQREGIKL